MTSSQEPAGEGVAFDTNRPHMARVYDFWLGGKDNYAADRAVAERVPDPAVRGFLLQNLRRDGTGPDARWRWQMNLDLLGDRLPELGGWPDGDLGTYEGPVLWLAGDDSPYVTPEAAPAMRALFPRVRLVRVKGAGHWVHADQPAVFVETLRRFLRST